MNVRSITAAVVIFVLTTVAAREIPAATYTVTTAGSPIGPGSLGAAIYSANLPPAAADTILFNIPGTGPHYILPTAASPLPVIADTTVIDGYSQPGAVPNWTTSLSGTNAAIEICIDGSIAGATAGLAILADGCVVKGLSIVNFAGAAIAISGGNNNEISGDFLGIYPDGYTVGACGFGVRMVNSADNKVGGDMAYHRNIIGANADLTNFGVLITESGSTGNEVKNTLFALTRTGRASAGLFMHSAIGIDDASDNVVGGVEDFERNYIANSLANGITIMNSNAERNLIVNNYIGTDITGETPMTNLASGILILSCGGNIIGGVENGLGNLIRYNGHNGVTVDGSIDALENRISRNAICDNAGLGIDLDDDGVTANDGGDADVGANLWQNYPECPTTAYKSLESSIMTVINGRLNSTPGTEFRLEFFRNEMPRREGRDYLGHLDVSTDAWGNVVFTKVAYGATLTIGDYITTTATDPDGNTSEFSAYATVEIRRPLFEIAGEFDKWWGPNLWDFQIELWNVGPGAAWNVSASIMEIPQGVSVVDGTCWYGDMHQGEGSIGGQDLFRLDLSQWQGGSFVAMLEISYSNEAMVDGPATPQNLMLPILLEKPTGTGVAGEPNTPRLELGWNAPNPFSEATTLNINLTRRGDVTLTIHDVLGRHVRTLVEEPRPSGPFQVRWDGRDGSGRAVPSGVYFCRLRVDGRTLTRSLTLVR